MHDPQTEEELVAWCLTWRPRAIELAREMLAQLDASGNPETSESLPADDLAA